MWQYMGQLEYESFNNYVKKLIDHIVNNIWLMQNLICVLKVWRTYKLMVRFLKYVMMLILLSNVVTIGYKPIL